MWENKKRNKEKCKYSLKNWVSIKKWASWVHQASNEPETWAEKEKW